MEETGWSIIEALLPWYLMFLGVVAVFLVLTMVYVMVRGIRR